MTGIHKLRFLVLLGWLTTVLLGCVQAEPIILIQTRFMPSAGTVSVVSETSAPIIQVVTATPSQDIPVPAPTPRAVRMFLPPAASVSSGETALALWLSAHAEVDMQVSVPHSEAEVLDAFARGQADVAWLATPAYLLANERHGVQARWRGLRQGMSDYRGQWLVQADAARQERDLAPLQALEDLAGASVAFTDPHSTTGYLFPRAMLRQGGLPVVSETFMGGDAQAVLAVYRGEVDAAATFWAPPRSDATPGDARALIAAAHPDVFARVKVLCLSDPIPNDPIVYRRDLDQVLVERLSVAFVELGRSDEGRALLQSLYGLNGLAPTQDSDYDGVRAVVAALDLDLEAMLAPTALP